MASSSIAKIGATVHICYKKQHDNTPRKSFIIRSSEIIDMSTTHWKTRLWEGEDSQYIVLVGFFLPCSYPGDWVRGGGLVFEMCWINIMEDGFCMTNKRLLEQISKISLCNLMTIKLIYCINLRLIRIQCNNLYIILFRTVIIR